MLTFQELFSSTFFSHAEILGGWEGKTRSFLHASESAVGLTESVILILPFTDDTVYQLSDYVSLEHVQGVVLYESPDQHGQTDIKSFLSNNQKPILFVKEASVAAIKKNIDELLHLKSMGLFHYVWEQSTRIWLQLAEECGLDAVLQRLHVILGEDVCLVDEHFHLTSVNGNAECSKPWQEMKTSYFQLPINTKDSVSYLKIGDDHFLLIPIRSEEQLFGFVVLKEQPGMKIDLCIEQITHAIPAMVTLFKKEEAVVKAHQSYKDQFLYNLLYNNLDSEEILISQGRQWGWDFTKPAQLMVMKVDPGQSVKLDMAGIMKRIRSVIQASFLSGITYSIQGNIVIIIFDSRDQSAKNHKEQMLLLAKRMYHQVQEFEPSLSCEIGLGRKYSSNLLLYRSFYEAKVALELGKYETKQNDIRHFEDIGVARLLSNVHNDILHDFYYETLEELILLDRDNEEFLLETLEVYYQHNGDINKTSEQLYMHPNTLRKRLRKMESILSVDFNQFDDLLKIFLALKIMKMLK